MYREYHGIFQTNGKKKGLILRLGLIYWNRNRFFAYLPDIKGSLLFSKTDFRPKYHFYYDDGQFIV